MRFSGYTGIADYEDHMDDDEDMGDDSDIEDTNLRPDDALILVAKTEEVCVIPFLAFDPHVFFHPSYPSCLYPYNFL
jgi:hypothetical protein